MHLKMNRSNKRRQINELSDSSDEEIEDTIEEDLLVDTSDSSYVTESDSELESLFGSVSEDVGDIRATGDGSKVKWVEVPTTFVPRKVIPVCEQPEIFVDENITRIDLFFKVFPKSLFMWIASCTNERLEILAETEGKEVLKTDAHEMMVVIGCLLVMGYNRLPHMQMYWSNIKSLGNKEIKSAIARDRFLLLASKLYFNHPDKPVGAGKTYYIDELVQCFKDTFKKARSDSVYQSIDETMVKFKGRSAMKQYMKIKKIKRGIKIWSRSDAMTGYAYDFNVYKGKETEALAGTLGERVVITLCSTIRDDDVVICTDRFFTSYELMKTLPFACVGTIMGNRKNVPIMKDQLQRGESQARCSEDGIIAFKWQDTKEVLLLSNCHNKDVSTVVRKQKDGSKKTVDCPEAIAFYNKYMGGVDMTDQYTVLYDIDRKSNKWWRRVFQRLLMTAVSNAWILHKQIKQEKIPLIDFLVPLAESLIAVGKSGSKHQRKTGAGRPSKRSKTIFNAHHLPIESTSRRCRLCATKKIHKRTIYLCSTCEVPLCVLCFLPYHQ